MSEVVGKQISKKVGEKITILTKYETYINTYI